MAAYAHAPARDPLFCYLRPVTLPGSPGLFGKNAGDDRDSDDNNLSDLESFLGDLLGSLSTGRSSNRATEKMDPYKMISPVASGNWKQKRTAEGIHLRLDMPGLGKEDVKVTVKENTVFIKGEGKKEFEDDDNTGPGYNNTLFLSERFLKVKEMKAEMKNGVLRVFVPWKKDEESGDVFDVRVE